ncbi:uncharacterized protein A4U43_C10F19510 [Asparagus officinalis]|uniref:Glutaredoxin domain-containing protein n=1 Tax=Asparagus officinalis TaxID=4686 RepID=A0A5P1E3Z7_ASPOF|nr:glutaredoxin-like [Asparagus officinalis]ONK57382.1 uncharacterized protein A4U43_C10F19510 [Asparagus officinalis]
MHPFVPFVLNFCSIIFVPINLLCFITHPYFLIHCSKSYCQFSGQVKQLLSQLNASYKVMELDRESDGYEVQSALVEWTGQRTVPNVFIGGKHIGGCDSVIAKHRQGKLMALLTEAGALAT